MNVKILNYSEDKAEIDKIKQRSNTDLSKIEDKVKQILKNVRKEGNKALLDLTLKFDNVKLNEKDLIIRRDEFKRGYSKLSEREISAIKTAGANIRKFAELQMPKPFLTEISSGINCGVLIKPIEKVGCYILIAIDFL